MGCIYTLLKVAAGLIGVVLTLAGFGGFCYGVFLLLKRSFALGAAIAIGGIVILAIATILGKFCRGDYDLG